jgi:hypothetical protein
VLAIATYATKSYFHVWPQFLRRIAAAAGHHAEAHFILATDQSEEAKAAVEAAKVELPEGWRIQAIALALDDGGVEGKDYKQPAQMRIAALQGAAFAAARKIRATALWSVEADNLVPPDALRVAEWALAMPTEDGSPLASGRASASGGWPSGSANARQTATCLRSRPSTAGAGEDGWTLLTPVSGAGPLCRPIGAALAAL